MSPSQIADGWLSVGNALEADGVVVFVRPDAFHFLIGVPFETDNRAVFCLDLETALTDLRI